MMGGGAFDLLKTGRAGPESAKQVEIGLAGLPKILSDQSRALRAAAGAERPLNSALIINFRLIWLIRPQNCAIC